MQRPVRHVPAAASVRKAWVAIAMGRYNGG